MLFMEREEDGGELTRKERRAADSGVGGDDGEGKGVDEVLEAAGENLRGGI